MSMPNHETQSEAGLFLAGKYAIVTGATRGIGRAIALRLASAGANVAITGRSEHSAHEASAAIEQAARASSGEPGIRVIGAACDAGDSAAVARFFTFVDGEFGALDILVNNAGIGTFRDTASLTIPEWNEMIATNLSGAFYASREALARFATRGGGYIINISSLAGKNPFAGGAAYNASKFGLNGFSEAMMLDHRGDNVKVSYIMPGSVDTEFGANHTGAEWKIAPEDIADIVEMLLRMPARTLVSRVEVRPSKPPKK
jgi:3-oxoacyl-[acyl-carrier protein] reductase